MTVVGSASRPLPADADTISGNDVDKLAMAYWSLRRKRPYRDLSYTDQIWLWDHMRWVLQNAGFKVGTNAEWICEVGPPEIPVKSASDLTALLRSALKELKQGQPTVTAAIMSALDFVQRISD
jgi:hypothetical protein